MFQHGRLRICHKQFFYGRIDCALRPSFDRADGVCNAVAKDISRLSDEELKQKLEFIMGPPEEPDPEELVYSGPRFRIPYCYVSCKQQLPVLWPMILQPTY